MIFNAVAYTFPCGRPAAGGRTVSGYVHDNVLVISTDINIDFHICHFFVLWLFVQNLYFGVFRVKIVIFDFSDIPVRV